MKKVLIVIGALNVGGGENMVYELIKNIDKKLYDVSVLCYTDKSNSIIETNIEKNASIIYARQNGKIGVFSICRVFKIINQINPDIIHAHLGGMVYAIPWSFLHPSKALVVTAHTQPSKAFNKKVEWLLKIMLKHRKRKTVVVAVSKMNHAMLKSYFGIQEDVCKYINNGIDLSRFYRQKHDNFTFINVARQDQNKNQKSIINAFSKLYRETKSIRLILAGDGPTHNELISQTYRLGVSDVVEFPGTISNVEDYYAVSDVYVQSSYREAMPLSVLEAMAAGLPIISTDVGGLRDVVKENGVLIEAGNDDALYNSMKLCLKKSSKEKSNMSAISLNIVDDYSSKKMAEGYMCIYDQLIC